MYDYTSINDSINQVNSSITSSFMITMVFAVVFCVIIFVYTVIVNWKVYEKAGRKGWESIVPFYNMYVLVEIAGLQWWYFVLFFIPYVSIFAIFKVNIEIAHKFNKSTGFGIGLSLLNIIFMSILAFSKDATYTLDSNNNINNGNNYNPNMNGYNGMNMNNYNNYNNSMNNQPNNINNNNNVNNNNNM